MLLLYKDYRGVTVQYCTGTYSVYENIQGPSSPTVLLATGSPPASPR